MFVPRPQYHPEIFCTYDTKSSRESEVLRLASGHDGNQPWADRLEGENVTALSTTASKDTTAALRAAADKKTVRASALGLGGLVGTLSSHDYSLMSGRACRPVRNRISAAEEFRAAKKRSASAHSSLSPTAPRYGAGLEEA